MSKPSKAKRGANRVRGSATKPNQAKARPQIAIARGDKRGFIFVPAYSDTDEPLVITKCEDNGPHLKADYAITHVTTGMKAIGFPTLAKARERLKIMLRQQKIDWRNALHFGWTDITLARDVRELCEPTLPAVLLGSRPPR
jgi:hypothetical protein